MSRHVTHYTSKDGKTCRDEEAAGKPAVENGDPGKSGSDNPGKQPENPAKQGAK